MCVLTDKKNGMSNCYQLGKKPNTFLAFSWYLWDSFLSMWRWGRVGGVCTCGGGGGGSN